MQQKGAYFLSLLKSNMKVYQKNQEGILIEFDLDEYLMNMKNESSEIEIYLKKGKESIKVRLVITRVPKKVMDQRLRKINKKNQKKGRTTTDRTKRRQAFNLFISNIPAEVVLLTEEEYQELSKDLTEPEQKLIIRTCGRFYLRSRDLDPHESSIIAKKINIINKKRQQLLRAAVFRRLYSIRWQIEIIFKNWKSNFALDKITSQKKCFVKCQIYAKLLYIFITHKMMFVATNLLWETVQREVSTLSAGKHFKVVAGKWLNSVINDSEKVVEILSEAIEFLMRNCVKSQKKGAKSPLQILAEVIELDFNLD